MEGGGGLEIAVASSRIKETLRINRYESYVPNTVSYKVECWIAHTAIHLCMEEKKTLSFEIKLHDGFHLKQIC